MLSTSAILSGARRRERPLLPPAPRSLRSVRLHTARRSLVALEARETEHAKHEPLATARPCDTCIFRSPGDA